MASILNPIGLLGNMSQGLYETATHYLQAAGTTMSNIWNEPILEQVQDEQPRIREAIPVQAPEQEEPQNIVPPAILVQFVRQQQDAERRAQQAALKLQTKNNRRRSTKISSMQSKPSAHKW